MLHIFIDADGCAVKDEVYRVAARHGLSVTLVANKRIQHPPEVEMVVVAAGPGGPPRIEEMTLEEVERVVIQKALARFDGNVSHAARALGLSRSALYRRLGAHGL